MIVHKRGIGHHIARVAFLDVVHQSGAAIVLPVVAHPAYRVGLPLVLRGEQLIAQRLRGIDDQILRRAGQTFRQLNGEVLHAIRAHGWLGFAVGIAQLVDQLTDKLRIAARRDLEYDFIQRKGLVFVGVLALLLGFS